jgi:RNA polymerase sigma-70 factor (ECF subfamily)
MNDAAPTVETAARRPFTRAEFDASILPCYGDVVRFARSLTRDAVEAEDLAQDTYLRAIRSWRTFLRGSDAPRWLLTICRNAFLSRRRVERRFVRGLDLDQLAAPGPGADSAASDGPRRAEGSVELAPAVMGVVRRLPECFRAILVMVDVQRLSYRQIAAVQGIPIGTVCSRVARARRALQRALAAGARNAERAARRGELRPTLLAGRAKGVQQRADAA